MALPSFIRVAPEGVFLSIKLQPRASANEVGEALGNELRVKVTAAPVDAAATKLSSSCWRSISIGAKLG